MPGLIWKGNTILIHILKRWYLPAFLLSILVLFPACGQEALPADNSPAPDATDTLAAATRKQPTPTLATTPSQTPLPVVDFKGISFTFDEQVLGSIGAKLHHAPVPPGSALAQPESLQIVLDADGQDYAPTLNVFPVAQYEAVAPDAALEISRLRALLAERPQEAAGDLPFLPMYRAVASFQSDPKYLDFVNGSGISYLTRVDHDHSLATDEAYFYTFQGLTSDEAYYVSALIPLGTVGPQADAQPKTTEGESADHQAKPANNNGSWIGLEFNDGRSLIDDIMLSLRVVPDETFPRAAQKDFFVEQGLFLGYDSSISGPAALERIPAVVAGPDGAANFLEGVPDMLRLTFAHGSAPAELHIQPLRDAEGAFFTAIPAWQRAEAEAIENDDPASVSGLTGGESAPPAAAVPFQNGDGWRTVERAGTGPGATGRDESAYRYLGVSSDGRYLVRLDHPLPPALPEAEATHYLDSLVSSLLVAADASTGSSMPLNAADCEEDAQFVEDVSIPDNTVVERGETFVKIWRVRNSGSCTWTPAYTVQYAQGNPLEWQAKTIAKIVAPGEEAEVAITVLSPGNAGFYQAWWQIADAAGEPFGDQLGMLFEAPEPATEIPGYGVIEGRINYPANGNPAVDIYFTAADSGERFTMRTEKGWTQYANSLPTGSYYVFARVVGDDSDSGGGYTEAVICGLHADCNDHSLIEVFVEEGRAAREINLFDWYAPAGSFPFPETD